jgi:hypothetical protein
VIIITISNQKENFEKKKAKKGTGTSKMFELDRMRANT